MALGTFSDLKTSVANYLARSDLTSYIPDFITLAESRLNKDVRLRHMLKRATTATTASDDTVAVPTNFLGARDVFVQGNPKTPLTYVTPSHYAAIYGGSVTGKPKVYTIIGSEIRLGPSPDGAYTLEILYYQRVPALSDANTTNDILVYYPDLYLYATLLEAEPFLQNDARIQTWLGLYQNAVTQAAASDDQEKFAGTSLTMRSLYS
jgi:hypothetical protein